MNSKMLFAQRKYFSLTIAVIMVFFYLLITEIYDRYSNTWNLYQAIGEKQATVLDPALLQHRKKVLTAERDSLSSKILNERSAYQQNGIGVIQCVSENARKNQVSIESFVPQSHQPQADNKADEHAFPKGQAGQFEEFDFGISVKAGFNKIGMFINGIENETIPIDITKVQMISDPIGNGNLRVSLQAKAYVCHGIH